MLVFDSHFPALACGLSPEAQAVKAVNSGIDSNDAAQLLTAFHNSAAQFPHVYDFAAPLYLEELASIKAEKQVRVAWGFRDARKTQVNAIEPCQHQG